METSALRTVLRHVRKIAGKPSGSEDRDAELLDRFINQHDGGAISILIQRHGPMVRGICRRVLKQSADADDVFQATFVVLLRKARSIRKQQSLGSWLYGVAYRIALRANSEAARRQVHERRFAATRKADPESQLTWQEICSVLDAELHKLAEKHRSPLVLCYLQGQTRDEAAQQLGWSVRTLKRRLHEGRKLLHDRLSRRGLTLSAALLGAGLTDVRTCASVPAQLLKSLVQILGVSTSGEVACSGRVPARIAALAEGAVRAMPISKLSFLAVLIGAAGVFAAGWASITTGADPKQDAAFSQVAEEAAPTRTARNEPERTDPFGDPLPPGALARYGTIRWRLDNMTPACMVMTQDGKSLLAASGEAGIALLDPATGKTKRQIPDDPKVRKEWLRYDACVALSGNGRIAAIASPDGTVHIVDVDRGKEIQRCIGHAKPVQEAALSADGEFLITRSHDETFRVWHALSGKELRRMAIPDHPRDQYRPATIALSADGQTLAWIGNDRELKVHICETLSGKELHSLGEHKGYRRRVAFSPNGRMLVTTSDGGPGQLWDVASGKVIRPLDYWRGHEFPVATFTLDNKALIITVGQDGTRKVDVTTKKEYWYIPRKWGSTMLDVFAFSPDGRKLMMTIGGGCVIHRYDVATGQPELIAGENTSSCASLGFSTDGRWVHAVGHDDSLHQWNIQTGTEKQPTSLGTWYGAFSPTGNWFAWLKNDGVHLLDIVTGKELWNKKYSRVWAFSADGRSLAVSDEKQNLLICDTQSGKESCRIAGANESWSAVEFGGGASYLLANARASGQFEDASRVYVWDCSTGRECTKFTLPRNTCQWMNIAPDGKTIAVQLVGGALSVWEVATGKKRLELAPERSWPTLFRFSPEGRYLLVGSHDGSLRFYDVGTGQLCLSHKSHRSFISAVAFSPDGRRMTTASGDTTILVWDYPALLSRVSPITAPKELALNSWWADLASDNATKAHQALWNMAAVPKEAVPFLGRLLQPVAPTDKAQISRLITDLEGRFLVRRKAGEELEKIGEPAEAALRKALDNKPSLDVQRQIESLLEKISLANSPEKLRALRSIEILEQIGTPQARELLEVLATGAPEARLTREARESLERTARRNVGRK